MSADVIGWLDGRPIFSISGGEGPDKSGTDADADPDGGGLPGGPEGDQPAAGPGFGGGAGLPGGPEGDQPDIGPDPTTGPGSPSDTAPDVNIEGGVTTGPAAATDTAPDVNIEGGVTSPAEPADVDIEGGVLSPAGTPPGGPVDVGRSSKANTAPGEYTPATETDWGRVLSDMWKGAKALGTLGATGGTLLGGPGAGTAAGAGVGLAAGAGYGAVTSEGWGQPASISGQPYGVEAPSTEPGTTPGGGFGEFDPNATHPDPEGADSTVTEPPPDEGGDEGGGEGEDGGEGGGGAGDGLPPLPDLPPPPEIPTVEEVPEIPNPADLEGGGEAIQETTALIAQAQLYGRQSTLLGGEDNPPVAVPGLLGPTVPNLSATRPATREGTRGTTSGSASGPTLVASFDTLDAQYVQDGKTLAESLPTTPYEPTALPDGWTVVKSYAALPYEVVTDPNGATWLRSVITGELTENLATSAL